MRRALTGLCLLFSICALARADQPPVGVHGEASLGETWTVLAPLGVEPAVDWDVAVKATADQLSIGDAVVKAKPVAAKGGRIDFRKVYKDFPTRSNALVYIPVNVSKTGWVTLGFGADWWFKVWVNGEPVLDTLEQGNEAWPPHISNHTVTVKLDKGRHLLAVRFVAGRGSAVLTAGGPQDLEKVGPTQWKPAEAVAVDREGLECVTHGDFEKGAGGFLPVGWANGPAGFAFKPAELSVVEHAPLEGRRSLRIRTADDGLRMMSTPVKLDPKRLYKVRYAVRFTSGNYLSIAVQGDAEVGNTGFLQAVGKEINLKKYRAPSQDGVETYEGYYYFDKPDMHLVLRAHGAVDAVVDNLSIRPLAGDSRRYHSHGEQRRPWDATWFDQDLKGDVRTPHTPWAIPLQGGPIKLLGLMPRWHGRVLVELAQRMSIEHAMIPFDKHGEWERDWWTRGEDRQVVLVRTRQEAERRLAEPVDCLLMWELNASTPGRAVVDKMLEKVAAGSGLVITGFDQPYYPYPDADRSQPRDTWKAASLERFRKGPYARALHDDNRVDPGLAPPGTAAKVDIEFFRYGKGRIALVKTIDPAWWVVPASREQFEIRAAMLLKVIRWASRRDGPVAIQGVRSADKAAPSMQVRLTPDRRPHRLNVVLDRPAGPDCALKWWIEYDAESGVLARGSIEAPAQASELVWTAPEDMPWGRVLLRLQLVRGEAVIDHATVDLVTTPPNAVQGIGINAPGAFLTNDLPVPFVIKLKQPLAKGWTLHARLEDSDGHVWQRLRFTDPVERVEAEFAPVPARALVHRLVVELRDGVRTVHRSAREICIVRDATWQARHFDYQVWQLPVGTYHYDYLGALAADRFRQHGITSTIHVPAHRNLALANIRSVPYLAQSYPRRNNSIAGDDPEHAPRMRFCLTGNGERGAVRKQITDRQIKRKEHGVRWAPLAYLVGHEQNMNGFGGRLGGSGGDPCFSDTCLAGFREMVKGEFGDLDKVNRAWRTNFKTWDEVTPLVLNDAVSQGTDGAMARWIDHRRHMDRVFLDFQTYKRDFIRRHAAGIEAVHDNFLKTDSFSGVDYWLQINRLVAGSGIDLAMLRSFSPPERAHLMVMRSSGWHPGVVTEDTDLYAVRFGDSPWVALLEGMHGFGYWAGMFLESPNSNMIQPVQPDLRTTDFARWSNAAVRRIRVGVHRLTYAGRFDDSGIAILYSRESEHAATAWRARHFRDPLAQRLWPKSETDAIGAVLHRQGYQFRRISDEQIADGQLAHGELKLLVLPVSQALSMKAAESIRQFVRAGGTVLADVRPGVVDLHGLRHGEGGSLDDVFGVKQDTAWSAFTLTKKALRLTFEEQDQAVTADRALVGSGLVVQGAQSLVEDGEPVCLANRFGRGQAVLLNTLTSRLGRAADPLLAEVMRLANLRPLFKVTRLDAAEQRGPADLGAEAGEFGNDEAFMDAAARGAARPVLYRHLVGAADIVGISSYRQGLGAGVMKLEVTWPRPGHVYDLANSRYLGYQETGVIEKPSEGTAVFAVVPERLQQPTVSLGRRADPHGRTVVTVNISTREKQGADWPRAFEVRLAAPEGSGIEEISDTAVCKEGRAQARIVLPPDAPRGGWVVKVTDAVSMDCVETPLGLP